MPQHLLPFQIQIFVFIFGLCAGSFLNVVIARVPAKESIVSPGSRCPACKHPIPFYLNLPVISYILLKGKCRYCKTTIAIRYPLVELLTGFFALGTLQMFGPGLPAPFIFTFGCTLIAVSLIDFDHQIIPDSISIPGIGIFATSPLFLPEMTFQESLFGILLGGALLYGVAWTYYHIRGRHGMGGGDIKLLAMIGAATGPTGVCFTLFAGSVTGTLIGLLIALLNRSVHGQTKLPFGPFLSLGALTYIFWGDQLIFWYVETLGNL